MLSFEFFFFTFLLLSVYFFCSKTTQNILLLLAGVLFFLSWSWFFLAVHFFIVITCFLFANLIDRSNEKIKRKFFLCLCLLFTFGLLAFFKIKIMSIENEGFFWSYEGKADINSFYILPLGISFYTLQCVGYVIDIYRRLYPAEKNVCSFYLYAAFFPLISAGPIERYNHLSPQFQGRRTFNICHFKDGLFLIAFGLVKKLVVVNRLNLLVLPDHSLAKDLQGLNLYLYLLFGFFQMFLDFSAYTDIARGVAKLFHIEVRENFFQPYLAKNPSDLWRRWHATLVSWVRDYLYFPMVLKTKNAHISVFFVMLFLGLWHRLSFNFLLWSIYWSLLFSIYMAFRYFRLNLDKNNLIINIGRIFIMFNLTVLSGIFFLFKDSSQFFDVVFRLASSSRGIRVLIESWNIDYFQIGVTVAGVAIIVFTDLLLRARRSKMLNLEKIKVILTLLFVFIFISFGKTSSLYFIYMGY